MDSDDCYLANALRDAVKIFLECKCDFIYGNTYIGSSIREKEIMEGKGIKNFKLKDLLKFFYSVDYIIPSQSVFMTKSILEQIGLLDENLHYCIDLELFIRIRLTNPMFYRNPKPICFYRIHKMTKTSIHNESIVIAKNIYIIYKNKTS